MSIRKIGLIWFRIGIIGDSCECGIEPSGSTNHGVSQFIIKYIFELITCSIALSSFSLGTPYKNLQDSFSQYFQNYLTPTISWSSLSFSLWWNPLTRIFRQRFSIPMPYILPYYYCYYYYYYYYYYYSICCLLAGSRA